MSNPHSNPDEVPLIWLNTQGLDRHQNGTPPGVRHGRRVLRNSFVQNIRRQWARVIQWTLMLLFAIFLSYYFYDILVAARPPKGKLFPEPGDANLIIAVLSQIFGALVLWLYLDLLNTLRFQLLARDQGAQLLEVEQLSKSTGWMDTLRMCLIPGTHQKWAFQR
jgi:hypothetical protein